MQKIMLKYFIGWALQKRQTCRSIDLSMYFQIYKLYQILIFLYSPQYKEFHTKILHACSLHHSLCPDLFL
jgi:hypothetical protein